jgi:hypothetical protein
VEYKIELFGSRDGFAICVMLRKVNRMAFGAPLVFSLFKRKPHVEIDHDACRI